MIKSHPSEGLLQAFVAGELPPALALCVSAHVDMCRLCQRDVQRLEAQQAEYSLEQAPVADQAPLPDELDHMLSAILAMPEAPADSPKASKITKISKHIHWNQQKFLLPRALQQQVNHQPALQAGESWRQLGKLWRGRLAEHDEWRTSFYYIERGGEIPEHTHKGREITLVLSGSFVDGDEVYQEGDFIYRDGSHTHKPGADATEDCLCFTAVEAPLHFTTGATRLLNPLGKLLY
ncbi:ChrR family anti-sigma-E factor [Neiella marina]|uniref:ChrR family anti-sigma-E factor n=1 Tax=Neiella holothuriorum TaxID=2870530 RepID=A0ABS7ECK0_9GAMM|nr:ChrR family anti-sigma-E factor [Neiella holothuriorum]MBW8190045.1 ChrR family anti-sigma-E factor [Neiella holothuriorum]